MRLLAVLISGLLIVLIIISFVDVYSKNYQDLQYGVSFSPKYATYLKLDWQKTYLQILDDLEVKNLRIPTYWDTLEKDKDKYDLSSVDFMLSEAEKRGAKVMLVVGARQPRWPECHYPSWAKQASLEERQKQTLEIIGEVIKRYKDNKSIWAYQVENEPFAFWFGEGCDKPDEKFLKEEVEFVKKLDNKKPIVITDSGEWGFWVDSIANADILGSSIYRKAYNSPLGIYVSYPFPASYYQLKAGLVKKLSSDKNKKVIISELQAEPWLANKSEEEKTALGQSKLFSIEDFRKNVEFVKKVGFEQNYLWGVEWWYFMKEKGYPQYLEYAETLFK